VLATNRYRLTDQVRAYLRANSIESMLGVQPPIR